MITTPTQEEIRLAETQNHIAHWRRWGPYLSDRQWGTVREDYSPNGTAWDYFTHDQARSRAYRWGEDGIFGISDNHQRLCFAIALWNGEDSILKERIFGLTGSEGNHGEYVKEYYFYLDNTPTHSYMKALYKYPHAAFPYSQLVAENQRRNRQEPEFELLDTGVFDDNHYFDVFVEYAKHSAEDILIQITIVNQGTEAKTLHLLPTIWFRNTWSWNGDTDKPTLKEIKSHNNCNIIEASHPSLGNRWLYCQQATEVLFTDNETNYQLLFGSPNTSAYVKDGINDYIVNGDKSAVNPDKIGTKASADYVLTVGASETKTIHPYTFDVNGSQFRVDYEPAESNSGLFGGNSNWRGPIWFPVNFLIIESLQKFYYYLGDDFKVECPTNSGQMMTLWEVASELSQRLTRIFLQNSSGQRPVYGGIQKFQNDPHWQNLILFHEYFHGDNGAGIGASHQTGWTGLVAQLIQQFGEYEAQHQEPKIEQDKEAIALA